MTVLFTAQCGRFSPALRPLPKPQRLAWLLLILRAPSQSVQYVTWYYGNNNNLGAPV